MNVFLADQTVNVAVAVPTDATGYTWRVIDQFETVLVPDSDPVVLAGENEIILSVPAEFNTLVDGIVRGLRSVVVRFETPAGIMQGDSQYVIESESTLVVNINTFQTYGEATMNAYELFGLQGWNGATKQDRSMALVAARRNIAQLRYRYVFDSYQDIIDQTVGVSDLTLVSASQWAALPADFKAALKRAQILEADYLLTGGENPVDVKRRMGIISETVGESSMFMRSSKPIERAVCQRAMKELSKYVLNKVGITRT